MQNKNLSKMIEEKLRIKIYSE